MLVLPSKASNPGRALSGGWSKSGNMTTGNIQQAVGMQVEFPHADEYLVQFGIQDGLAAFPNAVADIDWSVEGNTVHRTISVSNGAAIAGCGQACKVRIRDASIINTGVGYAASVQISRGNRASLEEPATLVPVVPAGATASGGLNPTIGIISVASGLPPVFNTVNIPQDSGVISVFITAAARGAASVLTPLTDADGYVVVGAGATLLKIIPISELGRWIPLGPQASQLFFFNTMAAGNPRLTFSLTYGIDG